MATIRFKAKIHSRWYVDDSLAYNYVKVPELTRSHCDMEEFRRSLKYAGLANSDLFKGVLSKIRWERVNIHGEIRLDKLPPGVSIDTKGFLAVVTIEV